VENYRKMLLSMAEDARVILVKLADRLHNMRTLEHLPETKRARIALETREIYAPLAHRLGMAAIRWELEDLAFKFLEPDAYETLVKLVKQRRKERERQVLGPPQPLAPARSATSRRRPFGRLALLAPPALVLRLRAGFGVGSKADVLSYLLARGGADHSVKETVHVTGYTDRAVRTALEEVARAGFIREAPGRPSLYSADPAAWNPLPVRAAHCVRRRGSRRGDPRMVRLGGRV